MSPNLKRNEWEEALQNVILHGACMKRQKEDLITIMNESLPSTLDEQFLLLSKINNNAYIPYALAGRHNRQSQHKPTLHQHLLFSPGNSTNPSGPTCNDFAPTSFRQRTLHFLFFSSKLDYCYAKKMVEKNLCEEAFALTNSLQTPKEERRRNKKFQSVSHFGDTVQPALNYFNRKENLHQYDDFVEAVFASGVLLVRAFCSTGGFLITNDYSETGIFLPYKFVNMRYTIDNGGEITFKCTCSDFRKTAGLGAQDIDIPNDDRLRCMHTRLLYSKFERSIKQIPHVRVFNCPRLQKMLLESCHAKANASVVVVFTGDLLVLSVSNHPKSIPCFVTIHPKTHHIRCLGGCKNVYKHKRNKKKDYGLKELDESKLCSHVKAVIREEDLIDDFLSNDKEDKDTLSKADEKFNTVTGKWETKALGKHKPKNKNDPDFQR